MVEPEVKVSHDILQQPKEALKVFPAIVAFDDEFHYDLAAYQDPIQHAKWKPTYSHKSSHILFVHVAFSPPRLVFGL